MPKDKNNQSKTNNYSSFGLVTLIKLIQIEADAAHNGVFAIHASEGGYRVALGAGRFETEVRPTLKQALACALAGEWAKSEVAVGESALASSGR
jgi:hypothetical protein